jgi:exodeoxyribonuclease VII small subunit
MEELKFEQALEQLETIVRKLERGDIPLDEAITSFNDGMKLAKVCSDQLKDVEKQMNFILNDDQLENFDVKDGE